MHSDDIIPMANKGEKFSLLRSGVFIKTIPENFASTIRTCFDYFDFKNEILTLYFNGFGVGVHIHVDLINEGVTTRLLFGSNAEVDYISLDSTYNTGAYGENGLYCLTTREATDVLKIQNGKIIESECINT